MNNGIIELWLNNEVYEVYRYIGKYERRQKIKDWSIKLRHTKKKAHLIIKPVINKALYVFKDELLKINTAVLTSKEISKKTSLKKIINNV
jgi:hypothetical protein